MTKNCFSLNNPDIRYLLECPNKCFLENAYLMLLGRKPDKAGLVHYAYRLRYGIPRQVILAEIWKAQLDLCDSVLKSADMSKLMARYQSVRSLPLGKMRWRLMPRLGASIPPTSDFDWVSWANSYNDATHMSMEKTLAQSEPFAQPEDNASINLANVVKIPQAFSVSMEWSAMNTDIFDIKLWLASHDLPIDFMPTFQSFVDILKINYDNGVHIEPDVILDVFQGNAKFPVMFYTDRERTARHYLHMARHFLVKGQREAARSLLQASLAYYVLSAALELLANSFMDEGHYTIALSYYDAALKKENPSKWTYVNRSTILTRLSRPLDAVQSLAQGLKANPGFTFQLDRLDELSQTAWDVTQATLMTHAEQDDRELLIKAANEYAVVVYQAYMCAFGVEKAPEVLSHINLEKILIIADYHIPQCVRYRIQQKIEQLQSVGKQVNSIDWSRLDQHLTEVAAHDVVIFYRVPATPKVLKAMAMTNASGKLSIYEIDDLLFNPVYPPPIESYGGYVSLDTFRELARGMALFNAAARNCRLGLASTNPLRKKLAKLVFSGECLLHRNGIDHNNVFHIQNIHDKKTLDIFYGSGTQAHNSDFIELALPALEKILAQNEFVRLVIVGYLNLPKSFTVKYEKQLKQLPPVKSIQGYWSLLEQADINIAVLCDDEINACKSELKWFEAACFGLPSIVSDTENYREIIRNGEDALIAKTGDDWYQALKHLVDKSDDRKRIGNTAMKRIRHEYSIEVLSNTLIKQLEDAVSRNQSAESLIKKKCRIALVNVFFPPQSIGGATRVVADNFKALKFHHSDDFDLCVFTADAECRAPHQLSVYDLNGSRVYKATSLWRDNMDWHPKDPDMYTIFQEFLDLEQPDLIHFHCVQRLTASVVEAARDAKIPYIVTVHDAWWISDFQFLVDHKEKVYPSGHPDSFTHIELPPGISLEESMERKYYLKGLLRDAKKVLTVSNAFAKIYKMNGVDNIHVIQNGISDDLFWKPKDTSYTDKVIGAHIGGMSAHKGFFLIKDAVMKTQPKNMEFLVVDHSKEDGYEARELWGDVPVICIGRVPQNDIVDLYGKIDVLFAPSTWPESFGLVTREAAACGCWVVSSDMGGISEDIQEGVTGHVISPTKNDLINIIVRIDKEHAKYKENIESKINLSINQANMLAIDYKRLIGGCNFKQ